MVETFLVTESQLIIGGYLGVLCYSGKRLRSPGIVELV